jgi:catechol 2,3-dioxygenase-like lactoylglutathione lyase family enzyme
MIQRLTHMGICVSDLERSLRFYRDLLGCTEVGRLELEGEPTATLNGWPDVKVRAVYLERDGWRLELMEFPVPGWIGPQAPRPMNQLGLTHLSFRVADLDAVCARIEAMGGGVLRETLLAARGSPTRVIMGFDPDGVRLELIESPGDPAAVPGSAGYHLAGGSDA